MVASWRRLNSTHANVDALSDTFGQAVALLDALVNVLNTTSPINMALLLQLQTRPLISSISPSSSSRPFASKTLKSIIHN